MSTTKLPILNPNEFDLWKMRIEQYFLMTDYLLWEVILNSDSPAPTRVIEGVVQPVAPTTTELRLAIKNELKAHGTLLMALPDKHQLKFNIHKDAKTLMEAIEKSFGGNKETKKAVEAYHTNEPISVVASVSAASTKIPIFALPNVDTLRRNLEANGPTTMGFDMSKVECYNCQRKGHFARECRSLKDTRKNAMTGVFRQKRNQLTMPSWLSPLQVLLVLILSLPASPIYDRYHSRDGYHVIPPPYTGTFMPPKPNLVFHDAPNINETDHPAFNVELSPTKPNTDLSHTLRPSSPIIEDWVSDLEDDSEAEIPQNVPIFVQPSVKSIETSISAVNHKTVIPKPKSNRNSKNRKACFVSILTKSKLVPILATRPVTTVVQKTHVTRPRLAKSVITKPHSPRQNINRSPSPKASTFPLKVTTAKAPMVNVVQGNPQHALKDKGVIDSRCSRHMTGNMSYLSDFKELNGGYVAFGGNPKGGKISEHYSFTDTEYLVLSPEFKLPDKNPVQLRVPRENNMYNVDLKNIVPFGDLTCRFAKATLDESKLWHRRLGHINFKIMNKLNTNDDPTFGGKKPEFEGRKHESEVHVSPSSKFKDFSDNSINEINAADSPVPAVGQILTNNTNTFSAAGPSNAVVSPTHGKSSYVNTSQYPDDLNMPELEDITYSDDEEDVSAEADFTNLDTTIIVSPIPTNRVHKDHHVTQIIGDLSLAAQTRSMTMVAKDQDPSWIEAMQEELLQFKMQKIWVLVDLPNGKRAIAYASFMGFMMFQMDVKSAFLYETIEEEVYVCQPLGFEDADYPDKIYKVVKTLYGLHQAPRAWCETLANYLLENGFQSGKIDQTLFIKRQKGDILLIQIYVDDIIFGSTNKDLCKAFEKLMKDKFQMSSMGELTFFLGLQVKQKHDGIFISQDKYVAEILRKFGLTNGKSASTPIDTEKPLLKDPDGEDVDVHTYRSMIGSLMYLTLSRPDILFAVCTCAHVQVTLKASHLHAVKRIFRYLKGKPHLGLWYPKDSPFNLVVYLDSDYVGTSLDRKSTTGGCQFLRFRLISWQCKKQTVVATSSTEAEYVAAASCCA
nr:hypothetical protein [Tanacetum cinerariifolium]